GAYFLGECGFHAQRSDFRLADCDRTPKISIWRTKPTIAFSRIETGGFTVLKRYWLVGMLALTFIALPGWTQEKKDDKKDEKPAAEKKDDKKDEKKDNKKDEKPAEKKDDKKDEKKDEKKTTPTSGDKADLKWKFEKGKSFYQELTTETNQDMKVQGMDVKQKQKQTFYFQWTVLDQKEKDWVIEQKIVGVKMEIEIGGQKISYDSTNPGAGNNPLGEFFKALVDSKFTLTVTPSPELKVTKVEGRKEFVDKLGATNPGMKPLLDSILSEDALKQMADPSFQAIPNKEVTKGDSWKNTTTLSLGPIGSYETTYEYKYEGKDKDLD